MKKGFRQKLKERQKETGSLLCVGLDPLPEKTPECINKIAPWAAILSHMNAIVDATAEYACMFKPQMAHYEAVPGGRKALGRIIDHIRNNHPDIPIFLDCKRGDIDRTQARYRVAHFEIDRVDGMNFNPYMGSDCLTQLVDPKNPERAIVGLCYTSNPSAREVQDVRIVGGEHYWEFMAKSILRWAKEAGAIKNAGLVMAAAYKDQSSQTTSFHLKRVRQIVGDEMWFLIPGVGAQGGLIEETVKASFTGYGSIAINSSSGITTKSLGPDYAEAAAEEAKKLMNQMAAAIPQ